MSSRQVSTDRAQARLRSGATPPARPQGGRRPRRPALRQSAPGAPRSGTDWSKSHGFCRPGLNSTAAWPDWGTAVSAMAGGAARIAVKVAPIRSALQAESTLDPLIRPHHLVRSGLKNYLLDQHVQIAIKSEYYCFCERLSLFAFRSLVGPSQVRVASAIQAASSPASAIRSRVDASTSVGNVRTLFSNSLARRSDVLRAGDNNVDFN